MDRWQFGVTITRARHVHGPGGAEPDSRQQRDDRHANDVDDGGEDLAGQRGGLGIRRGGRDQFGQGDLWGYRS